jgi:hypothetical protein
MKKRTCELPHASGDPFLAHDDICESILVH